MTPKQTLLTVAGWSAILLVALVARPLLPVDETRYLSVAWEMWLRGDFLVPHLNGDPYAHKPPLLFWLMHLGWLLFGVSEIWPRMIAPLFALADLFLCVSVAKRLWPNDSAVMHLTPMLFMGSLIWVAYATLTMFDMLLVCFTLTGMLGLIGAVRTGHPRHWLLLSASIGLGLLAKGPIIFLFLLPPALSAPWWVGRCASVPWRRWYACVAGCTACGIGLALLWALPASIAGGSHYRDAILWHQVADRMVASFAHQRPWWWYLVLLPVVFFPWSTWPALWAAARKLGRLGGDFGTRLCLVWLAASLTLLSLVSGKQAHYLLPMMPPAALLAARALAAQTGTTAAFSVRSNGFVYIIAGALTAFAPVIVGKSVLPQWWGGHGIIIGLSLAALGVALRRMRHASASSAVRALALSSLGLFVILHGTFVAAAYPIWDVKPVANIISKAQREGREVAHVWRYSAQYQFAGRLEKSLDVIYRNEVRDWAAQHPTGLVIGYHRACVGPYRERPLHAQKFRGRIVTVWDAKTMALNPELSFAPCRT